VVLRSVIEMLIVPTVLYRGNRNPCFRIYRETPFIFVRRFNGSVCNCEHEYVHSVSLHLLFL
ncbi:hypothetical protein ACT7DP_17600, partial [Bacillus paranthracis]